jgi:type I restriction enzyme S subunit
MGFEPNNSILDIVEFNPTRRLKKGEIAPFVEMAAIPENDRNISSIEYREVKGGSRFKNGDTLFARITPCLENGKTAKVSGLAEDEIAHGSTEFIVMAAKEPEYDEDFVYYLSRLPEFRTFAQNLMQGTSGRQRVSWQSLTTYESCFPKKQIRKQVGQILRAFDDKIELNRQINQTLEAMAQAMFKSWFVDFEPVKAKMQALENGGTEDDANLAAMQAISGKTADQLATLKTQHPDQYQQLHHTASLFPSAMQDSELGEIPAGWEVNKIGDVLERLKPKKRYTKKEVEAFGKVPVYEQGNSILLGFHNNEPGFHASVSDPMFIFGDHTCITHLSCSVFDISQNVIPLKGKSLPTIWTYYAIRGKQVFQEYRRHWSELIVREIVTPNDNLAKIYSEMMADNYSLIECNNKESKTLEQLRDTLLPKLLSGELQISTEDAA